jgi:hypothetical protein
MYGVFSIWNGSYFQRNEHTIVRISQERLKAHFFHWKGSIFSLAVKCLFRHFFLQKICIIAIVVDALFYGIFKFSDAVQHHLGHFPNGIFTS